MLELRPELGEQSVLHGSIGGAEALRSRREQIVGQGGPGGVRTGHDRLPCGASHALSGQGVHRHGVPEHGLRGAVTLEFGIELVGVRQPGRGTRLQHEPPDLPVDLQLRGPALRVGHERPGGEPGDVRVVPAQLGEDPGSGALPIPAGLELLQVPGQHGSELGAKLRAILHASVESDRRRRLRHDHLVHAGLAQGGPEPADGLDERPHGEIPVPDHRPQRGPHRGLGQRIGHRMGQHRVQGRVVQGELGVGQVLIVGQDQAHPVGRHLELGQGRARLTGGHLDRRLPGAHEGAGGRGLEHAHLEHVRAQHLLARDRVRGLVHKLGRRGPALPRRCADLHAEPRHSRRVQPGLRPCVHVPAGGLCQRRHEVRERGIAPGMTLEVPAGRIEERLAPHEGGQLLEHRGALGVGDAVEVLPGRLEVDDVRHDRVGGRQLVLHIGPGLAAGGEGDP